MRIQLVKALLQDAFRDVARITLEVFVNVVRPRLGLCERTIKEHLGDANLPELADECLRTIDKTGSVIAVPGIRGNT